MHHDDDVELTDADWVEAASLCLLVCHPRWNGAQIHAVALRLCARAESRGLGPAEAVAQMARGRRLPAKTDAEMQRAAT